MALLYLVLGGLRLGWACEVLSKPIISAFLTAGAMIISLSQVRPSILGISRPARLRCHSTMLQRMSPPPSSRPPAMPLLNFAGGARLGRILCELIVNLHLQALNAACGVIPYILMSERALMGQKRSNDCVQHEEIEKS